MSTNPEPALRTPYDASVADLLYALGWKYAFRTAVFAAFIAAVIGVPTDVIPNPWFTRMTPVMPIDYLFLVASSLLTGAILATGSANQWFGTGGAKPAGAAGGVLGWLAIGCPICNKLIVGILGVSGALTYFGPIQPILGVAAMALGTLGLALRFKVLRGQCIPVPGLTGKCKLGDQPIN